MSEVLERALSAIVEPDAAAGAEVQRRLDEKTKPRGSLGGLERLAVRIAGIQRTAAPALGTPVVVVCAADHGVAAEGVSAYPSSVTAQMVANYASGGAAVSVLARRAGARLVVVDCGVAEPLPVPGVLDRRLGTGTASMLRGPAMPRELAISALEVGIRLASEVLEGAGCVALGEMGIGNSTAAAALCCALAGATPEQACGRGTGLDDEGLARKRDVVTRALALNQPGSHDPSALWRPSGDSSSACSPALRWERPAVACPCSSTATPHPRRCSSRPRWRRRCRPR